MARTQASARMEEGDLETKERLTPTRLWVLQIILVAYQVSIVPVVIFVYRPSSYRSLYYLSEWTFFLNIARSLVPTRSRLRIDVPLLLLNMMVLLIFWIAVAGSPLAPVSEIGETLQIHGTSTVALAWLLYLQWDSHADRAIFDPVSDAVFFFLATAAYLIFNIVLRLAFGIVVYDFIDWSAAPLRSVVGTVFVYSAAVILYVFFYLLYTSFLVSPLPASRVMSP